MDSTANFFLVVGSVAALGLLLIWFSRRRIQDKVPTPDERVFSQKND